VTKPSPCRSVADAQKAYNYAALFYVMHLIILGVGLALVLFYSQHPLPGVITEQLADAPDRIFPYFIITEIPVGLSGLFIAAIFAAAISTLDSALAESADLSVSHIYAKYLRPAVERSGLLRTRLAGGLLPCDGARAFNAARRAFNTHARALCVCAVSALGKLSLVAVGTLLARCIAGLDFASHAGSIPLKVLAACLRAGLRARAMYR